MQFVVIGYDGTDEGALDRRMAARQDHLVMAEKMHKSGQWLYAAALLDDNGNMNGSMIVCEFESRKDLETQWLDSEPYIKAKVWETIDIREAKVAPFWAV